MVATFVELRSSAVAVSYYERDGYYAKNDPEHRKASFWHGAAARALGLRAHVRPTRFEDVLSGRVPGTEIRLGRMREGERDHRPGWDITFSAPKSVSLEALVLGDRRVIRAHDDAVRATLEWAEGELLETRGWDPAARRRPRVKADGMVVAGFRHLTSRDGDPQLHTHCVLANMTRNAAGEWRSVEPTRLRREYQADGGVLPQRARAARAGAGDGGDSHPGGPDTGLRAGGLRAFVPGRVLGAAPGDSRAPGASRAPVHAGAGADGGAAHAAAEARHGSGAAGAGVARPGARARAGAAQGGAQAGAASRPGYGEAGAAARSPAAGPPRQRAAEPAPRADAAHAAARSRAGPAWGPRGKGHAPSAGSAGDLSAEPETGVLEAVARAVDHASERRTALPEAEIRAVALGHAPGRYGLGEIDAAIGRLVRDGALIEVERRGMDRAFVTDRAVKAERRVLAAMRAGRGAGKALADAGAVEEGLRARA